MQGLHARLAWALAAVALLAACDEPPEGPPPQDSARMKAPPDEAPPPPPPPVAEAELVVPLYPGATLLQPQSSRLPSGDGSTVTGVFEVDQPPAVVAAYYRDQLSARAEWEPPMETTTPTGQVTLILDNPASNSAIQVEISPAGRGSRVKVITVRFPTG